MDFSNKLKFSDRVSIDGGTVVGRVIGFCFYSHECLVLVSWWNSGSLIEQWIADWRLALAEEVAT